MRLVLSGIAFSFAIYLILVLLAYLFQRSLLYFPDREAIASEYVTAAGFREVQIGTENGIATGSYWRPPSNAAQPIILHFHGNAGSHGLRLPLYAAMAEDGAGILGAGYPGYGGNAGEPGERAFYATAERHYDWLIDQGFAAEQIVIAGQSLGTGVAVWLAERKPAAGLILEAAYTGMDDMAQRQFPWMPAKLLTKDRFRSLDRIADIDMPLSWIHGTNDALIPYAMGQQLFDAAAEPKFSRPIKNGGHNDLWQRGIDRLIRQDAARFVNSAH